NQKVRSARHVARVALPLADPNLLVRLLVDGAGRDHLGAACVDLDRLCDLVRGLVRARLVVDLSHRARLAAAEELPAHLISKMQTPRPPKRARRFRESNPKPRTICAWRSSASRCRPLD